MNVKVKIVLKRMLALAGVCALQLHAAEPPKYQEVYSVIRSNLSDLSATDLERLSVQGLLSQLPARALLATNQTDSGATSSGAALSRTNVFDDAFAYLRVANVGAGLAEQISTNIAQLKSGKKIKGLVLDLRYTRGDDYPAAVAALDQFVTGEQPQLSLGGVPLRTTKKDKAVSIPVTVLVNRETFGAAEALAALLRQNHVGLIIGSTTAGGAFVFKDYPLSTGQTLRIGSGVIRLGDGEPLSAKGIKPDITLEISAAEEKTYFDDPYKEFGKVAPTAKPASPLAAATTNTPRHRLNEAELVRRQREGQNPDEDVATGRLRDLEPAKPTVQDPALARALDLLKGLAVVKQLRNP